MNGSPSKLPTITPKRGKQTLKELQDLQKLAASVIMQPLARGFKSPSNFTDGRPNEVVAAGFHQGQ